VVPSVSAQEEDTPLGEEELAGNIVSDVLDDSNEDKANQDATNTVTFVCFSTLHQGPSDTPLDFQPVRCSFLLSLSFSADFFFLLSSLKISNASYPKIPI
jgi:hypothetical protein